MLFPLVCTSNMPILGHVLTTSLNCYINFLGSTVIDILFSLISYIVGIYYPPAFLLLLRLICNFYFILFLFMYGLVFIRGVRSIGFMPPNNPSCLP